MRKNRYENKSLPCTRKSGILQAYKVLWDKKGTTTLTRSDPRDCFRVVLEDEQVKLGQGG